MKNRKSNIYCWNEFNFVPKRVQNIPGEVWKRIKGFTRYCVSNYGRIKRMEREQHRLIYLGFHKCYKMTARYFPEMIKKDSRCGDTEYRKIQLIDDNGKSQTLLVHRIVAEAFLPNPLGLPEVDHKDGNPANNSVDNLKWVTRVENNANPIRKNRQSESLKGIKKPPMTQEQKDKIRKTISERKVNCKKVFCAGVIYDSAKCAAEQLGETYSTLRNWLNGNNPMPEKYKKKGLKYL